MPYTPPLYTQKMDLLAGVAPANATDAPNTSGFAREGDIARFTAGSPATADPKKINCPAVSGDDWTDGAEGAALALAQPPPAAGPRPRAGNAPALLQPPDAVDDQGARLSRLGTEPTPSPLSILQSSSPVVGSLAVSPDSRKSHRRVLDGPGPDAMFPGAPSHCRLRPVF